MKIAATIAWCNCFILSGHNRRIDADYVKQGKESAEWFVWRRWASSGKFTGALGLHGMATRRRLRRVVSEVFIYFAGQVNAWLFELPFSSAVLINYCSSDFPYYLGVTLFFTLQYSLNILYMFCIYKFIYY